MKEHDVTVKKDRENMLAEYVKNGLEDLPLDAWQKIEQVYSGNYASLAQNDDYRFKSHLLNDAVETHTAMLMPEAYQEFQIEPANPNQAPDVNSAATAKAHLEYYFNRRNDVSKLSSCITTALLKNRCIVRILFGRNILPKGEGKMRGILKASESYGMEAIGNQPTFIIVDNKDFIIQRGFKTIDDAWSMGGFVGRQFYPHNDWVRKNPEYKAVAKTLRPDVKYKGQTPVDPNIPQTPEVDAQTLEFNCLWELFFAPRDKDGWRKGRYIVYSYLQNEILYDEEGMPFKGMGFPFRELVDIEPRIKFNEIPRAQRSLNYMLCYEWAEGKIRERCDMEKSIIVGLSEASDELTSWMESIKSVIIAPPATDVRPDAINKIDIRFDTAQLEIYSARMRAAWDNIWGLPGTASPMTRGKPIATELVQQNSVFQFRLNKFQKKFNKFVEGIAQDFMTITKVDVPIEEQERIARSVTEVWRDLNKVTLEGNYSIKIYYKPMRNQTHGEYMQMLGTALSHGIMMEQNPKYSPTLNLSPLFKAIMRELDVPTVGMFTENAQVQQEFENSRMMALIPMEVDPNDDHVGHLQSLMELFDDLDKAGDEAKILEEAQPLLMEHAKMHMTLLQRMQRGAAGMTKEPSLNEQNNPMNNMRSGMAADVGGGAMDEGAML